MNNIGGAMVTQYLGAGAPFHDRPGRIWMDGSMRPWREASLHVLSHALHYASAVFEGEKAYRGRVFALEQHSRRLRRSAELLDFNLPYSVEALSAATQEVVDQYDVEELYVRPVAWRGSEMMGVSGQRNTIHVAIAAWATPMAPSLDERLRGVALDVSRWVRMAPNMAPIASKAAGLYMTGTLAKHAAEAKGCDDALTFDCRGFVAEATTANIFAVIDGKLRTPGPDYILSGITRQTVLATARAQGLEVWEGDIHPSELQRASEVFLTGTAAEITAVRSIGARSYTPGVITEAIMRAYDEAIGRG
ncbi:branched-chain amino acid aminotransferase [Sphingosinicella sp.]|uniref:branched-chain amino acid aminotransferase n=1 Tax=Sphingosinicella sp. TaxID=1917971 RepID=UPI0025E24DCD|nr:branched-chain amino acid aminotransferase [Sphingosinicella sp.]